MELPHQIRNAVIAALDDYFENVNDEPDSATLAAFILRALESAAEEVGLEEAEDLIANLEEEAELDDPLVDVLADELGHNEELDLEGEEIFAVFESICPIDWEDEDGVEELDEFEFDEIAGGEGEDD